jgi:DNA primase catalytic core
VPERRAGERGQRAALLEALDAAATAYEQWLGDPEIGASARAYLERRGVTRETQREFRLGLAPAGWEGLVSRLRGRFSDEVLLEARLVGRKEGGRSTFDWFRNRLMVPLIAPGGAVLGFGARAFGDEQPKYLNSPESSVYHKGQFLYALEQARRLVTAEGEMVVVEGYFDAIAMHQAGIRNTVATSGTALTADHARALRRMVRGVALTYDGDAAGQQAMLRSLGVLLAEGLDVVVVDLPAGEDPDTLVRRAGADGWCKVRDSAYDAVEFVHRHVLRSSTGGDPRERALHVVGAPARRGHGCHPAPAAGGAREPGVRALRGGDRARGTPGLHRRCGCARAGLDRDQGAAGGDGPRGPGLPPRALVRAALARGRPRVGAPGPPHRGRRERAVHALARARDRAAGAGVRSDQPRPRTRFLRAARS